MNEADHIGALLDDLAGVNHEIIVVDGGSNDATQAQVGNRAMLISSRAGRAIQLNTGAQIATGELLLFLHADSRLPTLALNALVLAADAGAQWGRFDLRLSGHHPLLRIIEKLVNLRSRLSGIATGDQGIFVRRELFNQLGGYPPIALMEDIALCRQLKKTARPVCLQQTLVSSSRRWETRGIIRTILLMWWLRLAYFCGVSPQRLASWYGY